MLTDADISELISRPKQIVNKSPASGYREQNQNRRCDLELVDLEDERHESTGFSSVKTPISLRITLSVYFIARSTIRR